MKKIFSVILCSVLMVTMVACEKSDKTQESSSKPVVKEAPIVATKVETEVQPKVEVKTEEVKTKEVKTEEIKTSEVVLYFSDDQAMNLVGVKRSIENPTANSIVRELVKGPSAQSEGSGKLFATLPMDLEILDVQVRKGIAYVDFKGSATQKISGGSTGEGMALYSIINTLVLNKELGIEKVQFLIEGKNVDSIKGNLDVSKPMVENIELIKK